MTIRHIRIIHLVILAHSLFMGNFIWIYVLIWQAILEWLNTRKGFLSLPNYKTFNIIFIGYMIYINVSRKIARHLPEFWMEVTNRFEHIFFILVIGLLIYVILNFYAYRHLTDHKRVAIAFLLVNFFGVANEIFQAWYSGWNVRSTFVVDAWHDIITNTATACVAATAYYLVSVMRRKQA